MTSLACNKRSSSIRARKNPRWRAERACVCTCINRAIDPDVLFWRMLALYTVKFHAFIDNPCLCSWIKWISEMNTNESFYLYIYTHILLKEDKGNTIKFYNNKSSSWHFVRCNRSMILDVWNKKKDRYASSFKIRLKYDTKRTIEKVSRSELRNRACGDPSYVFVNLTDLQLSPSLRGGTIRESYVEIISGTLPITVLFKVNFKWIS